MDDKCRSDIIEIAKKENFKVHVKKNGNDENGKLLKFNCESAKNILYIVKNKKYLEEGFKVCVRQEEFNHEICDGHSFSLWSGQKSDFTPHSGFRGFPIDRKISEKHPIALCYRVMGGTPALEILMRTIANEWKIGVNSLGVRSADIERRKGGDLSFEQAVKQSSQLVSNADQPGLEHIAASSAANAGNEAELARIAADLENLAAFDPLSIEDARRKTLTATVLRQGQPAFRRSLLDAYERRCAVSDCETVQVLEAAHIVPYLGPNTNHVTNGLLLRADIHTLFDAGLITINQVKSTLIISPVLKDSSYGDLHGKPIRLPTDVAKRPSVAALGMHRKRVGL